MTSTLQRVLILGHSGYIGSRLQKRFCEAYPELEVVGHSAPELDLTQEEQADSLVDLLDPGTVLVMCSGIKKQYGDSLDIFLQNMAMVTNVCRLLQEHPVQRIVYFSSAEVYGDSVHDTGITEDTSVRPGSYYGIAKYASEGLFQKVAQQPDQGSLLVLRPALVYGPGEEGTFYGPTGFVRAALRGEPINLWGDGDELREFVYIDDLTRAVVGLTFHEFDGVVNVVAGRSRTFREIVEIVSQLVPSSVEVGSRARTRPKVDQAFSGRTLTRLLPELSFTSLEEGIQHVLDAERLGLGVGR